MRSLIQEVVGGTVGRVTDEISLNGRITVLGSLVGGRNTSEDMPRSYTDTSFERQGNTFSFPIDSPILADPKEHR